MVAGFAQREQVALNELCEKCGLKVVPSAFMTVHRNLIITLAAQYRLPAIYAWNYYTTSSGLASYGIDAHAPADAARCPC